MPKSKKMVSKHTKTYWSPIVGARVAAISGGKIVLGVVIGTKAKPMFAAAFRRRGFAGCWIQLDSGERVVANELRPVQEVQTAKGEEDVSQRK